MTKILVNQKKESSCWTGSLPVLGENGKDLGFTVVVGENGKGV